MTPQNENAVLGREYRPEPQNVVEQQAVNQNEGNAQVAVRNPGRRRARSRDSNESNDSYEPPRRNRGRNEVAHPVPVQQPQIRIPQPMTEIDRVQQLLRTFGATLKYQRNRGFLNLKQRRMINYNKNKLLMKMNLLQNCIWTSKRILRLLLNLKLERAFTTTLLERN